MSGEINLAQQASGNTPSSGYTALYSKTDGLMYFKVPAGTEYALLPMASLTQGSVLFVGASGIITQDNSNFFWDDSNNKLRVSGIVGITDGSSAAAGNIGELKRSYQALTNCAASGTWGNVTSIELTPGEWDVSAVVRVYANSATLTGNSSDMAISVNSGGTTTDHVGGDNAVEFRSPTSGSTEQNTVSIPKYPLNLTLTTTVFLKTKVSYSAGTPQHSGRISARRVR